jgi:MtrB/PioB family decaheme-associated outer membrane protein
MRNNGLNLSVFLPVLLLGIQSPLTEAADTESSKPLCRQCIKYTGWRGVLDFGLGYVSDDSLRFGDYRGLEDKGFYAAIDGDVHYRNLQGQYFDLYARDLGLDSRLIEMRGGNQGRYELRFGWQETPKYRGFGTQTPFTGVGSDYLTLPADWVHSATTGGMTALNSSLAAAFLKTQRKTLDAGATVKFARNWSFKADFQQQKKEGTRSLGGGLYFNNSTLLPAAVDFTTNQFDLSLMWTGRRGQVQLGYFGSYFDNGKTSMTWANPFSSQPEHQAFRAALEPDNEFYQFNLSAAFAVTSRIHLSGRAAMGQLTQDDAFLPYTINPRYSDLPLPRSSLNGKLDTSTFNLSGKLSARLNNGLSFTARAKLDERDNKTPVDTYTQVPTDLFPTVNRYNRPYSYERQQYSADLRYRAHRVVRLSGGVLQDNRDRTLQAVERSEETTFWVEVKVSPIASTQIRFKLDGSNRDVSDYSQPNDGSLPDHPLMRKFNQADRDRERARIDLDFAPSEHLGINLSYFKAQSDYLKSEVGLQESNDQSYSINLSYAVGKKINLYAFWSRDDIDAELINTPSTIANAWTAVTRDLITTMGLGISARINDKSSIGFDFVSADSKGDISVQTSNEEEPFDPLRTDLRNARVHYDREVGEHWGFKLYAEYEEYSSRNWAIDGLGVDGISSVLTMGDQSPEYEVWYFRVQASYRF